MRSNASPDKFNQGELQIPGTTIGAQFLLSDAEGNVKREQYSYNVYRGYYENEETGTYHGFDKVDTGHVTIEYDKDGNEKKRDVFLDSQKL